MKRVNYSLRAGICIEAGSAGAPNGSGFASLGGLRILVKFIVLAILMLGLILRIVPVTSCGVVASVASRMQDLEGSPDRTPSQTCGPPKGLPDHLPLELDRELTVLKGSAIQPGFSYSR